MCVVAYPFGNMTQETGRREAICDLYGGELRWAGFSPTCIQGVLSCPSMPRAPVTGSKRALALQPVYNPIIGDTRGCPAAWLGNIIQTWEGLAVQEA